MVLAWWLVLESTKWRTGFIVLIWCVCFISLYGTWSPKIYQYTSLIDSLIIECVEKQYTGNRYDVCQGIAAPEYLDRAMNLGVKFTRQFAH
jgi:hypothetical protein